MRTGFHHYYPWTFLFLAVLSLGSCDRKNEDTPIIPPVTPPLSRQFIGYGVINVSYTHVVEEPERTASSLGYLRRGAIVKILERRMLIKKTVTGQDNRSSAASASESWVLAEGNFRGWLPETVVDIYDNERQARTAAESLVQ